MPADITLLVSSAGRRVALIDCFRADAASLGLSLRVICIDTKPRLSAACASADAAYEAPRCAAPEFIPFVHEIVRRENVRLIVPTIDTELLPYAQAADEFARAGVLVNVPSLPAVQIARDKRLTADFFAAAGVRVPRTLTLSHFLRELPPDWSWPLIIKPMHGSSSIGVRRVEARADLDGVQDAERQVIQEFWNGTEFTVNMFFDAQGQLRCAVPHRRIEVRAGEVSKARTERNAVLQTMARDIAAALPRCRGALCFQAIVTNQDEAVLIEINARFGGGFPLAHAAGAEFSRWLLQEACGSASSAADSWRENVTMLRYDAGVFLDASA